MLYAGTGGGVYRSADGGATWTNVSTSLTATSTNVTLAATGTVAFRVRAVDRAGNVGAWRTGPTLTPRLVQESSTAITYAGAWSSGSSAIPGSS